MPKLSVDTYPVKALVHIYRTTPGYGTLAEGVAPQAAERDTPWGYAVKLGSVMSGGVLWVPVFPEQRGMCERDESLRFRYVKP